MKRAILLILLTCCTIGGEEVEKIATIETVAEIQEQNEEITFEEGLLSFAQCMREEGLDFPDPSFDSEGNPEFTDFNIDDQDVLEDLRIHFIFYRNLDSATIRDNSKLDAFMFVGEGF